MHSIATWECMKDIPYIYICVSLTNWTSVWLMQPIWYIHYMARIYDANTLRPRQKGRQFADDILKCIFLNENAWISNKISPKIFAKDPISIIPELDRIMPWRRPGDKPLSEPMMVWFPTHICVTRPQWFNINLPKFISITFTVKTVRPRILCGCMS